MTPDKRSTIAAAFGLIGFLTGLALVMFGDVRDLRYVWINEVGVVLLAGPCACIAGGMTARMFGKAGGWGWFSACVGGVLATALGSMFAGTLALPVIGSLLAPAVLFYELAHRPIIGIVWLSSIAILHIVVLKTKD